jgi:uncharacterized protein
MAIALITGASGGIGLELAKIHASKGDDLVLVARSKDKLDALKAELESKFKVSVYVIKKDLSKENSAQEVFEETEKQALNIDYLINNAGFGDYGSFIETDGNKEQQMLQLNISSLTHFSKLYLPEMVKRKNGKVMNVASTAAFQPGPFMAVYFATKAYVLSFSEAINEELKGTGVTVTALCPGPTESGFISVAAMSESPLVKDRKLPSSLSVAEFAYRAMMKGKAVAVHGLLNKILACSVRFTPRFLVVKIIKTLQEIKD